MQADRNTKIQVIIDVTYLTGKLLRLGRILDRSVDSRLFVEIWGRGREKKKKSERDFYKLLLCVFIE